VATLGTATSATHVQKLLRQTEEVVFCFDGDAAGRKAAWHALEVSLSNLADHKAVRFLFLPPEHDPDSFVREEGREAFERKLGEARPLSEFFLDELMGRVDVGTPEGRSRLTHEAKPLLQQISAPALQLQLLKALADAVGITQDEAAQLTGVRVAHGYGARPAPARGPDRGMRLAETNFERTLLQCLVSRPALAKELATELLDKASFEGRALQLVANFCRDNPQVDGNIVVDHFRETEFQALLESSHAALLDTKLGEEQVEAEFGGTVAKLRERRQRQRHDTLIAKQDRTPEEDAEMRDLMGQLAELKKSQISSPNNANISGFPQVS
jgi:DNA primase